MKTLKLKASLFSLIALFFVSVFVTSCSQQEIIPESIEDEITEQTLGKTAQTSIILPWGFDEKMSEEEQIKYANSVDRETFDRLAKSAVVLDYFESLDKRNVLADNAEYGDIFDASTVSSNLTREETSSFDTFAGANENAEARWGCDCGSWYYWKTRCAMRGVYGNLQYLRFDLYKKECHAWYCPDRIEERNYRGCY